MKIKLKKNKINGNQLGFLLFFLGTSNMIIFFYSWFTQILIYSFIHSMMIWLHRLLKSKFSSHFFSLFLLTFVDDFVVVVVVVVDDYCNNNVIPYSDQASSSCELAKKNPNKSKWIKFIPSFIHCGCCEFSISRKKNENEKNF